MTTFFTFLFFIIISWLCMWAFFRFMYPKPPKAFMPKEGDVITPRDCDLCGYPLAEYRGVLEPKPEAIIDNAQQQDRDSLRLSIARIQAKIDKLKIQLADKSILKTLTYREKKAMRAEYEQLVAQLNTQQSALKKITTWFFCNYEHQAEYHQQSNPMTDKN